MSLQDASQFLDPRQKFPNLIGDFTRAYALPLVEKSKHADLNSIDPTTLVALIDGDFNDDIDSFTIVDCRYPYEYSGGHIVNSVNIYTREGISNEFIHKRRRQRAMEEQTVSCFSQPPPSTFTSDESSPPPKRKRANFDTNNTPTFRRSPDTPRSNYSCRSPSITGSPMCYSPSSGRHIIIFHCEFSSERAPKLLRHLRERDRVANQQHYPKLLHPEIYLLEGGYKAFYESYKSYCTPQAYKPMHAEEHADEMRKYRSMTKGKKRLRARC